MAGFEWDPRKEQDNLRKHHFDFTIATLIWAGPVVEKIDDRRQYGETRIIATGGVGGGIIVIVHTGRGEDRRITVRVRAAFLRRLGGVRPRFSAADRSCCRPGRCDDRGEPKRHRSKVEGT